MTQFQVYSGLEPDFMCATKPEHMLNRQDLAGLQTYQAHRHKGHAAFETTTHNLGLFIPPGLFVAVNGYAP